MTTQGCLGAVLRAHSSPISAAPGTVLNHPDGELTALNQSPRGDRPHGAQAASALSRAKAGPRKSVGLGQEVLQRHLPGTSESADWTVSLSRGNILEPDHLGSDSDRPGAL